MQDRPVGESKAFACPNWTGGWVKCEVRGKMTMRPAECGRNYCWHCGERKASATRVALREGVLRSEKWKGCKTPFMTLTFRARRMIGPMERRRPETWAKWMHRVENYEPGGKGIIDLYKSRSWEKALETISEILAPNV